MNVRCLILCYISFESVATYWRGISTTRFCVSSKNIASRRSDSAAESAISHSPTVGFVFRRAPLGTKAIGYTRLWQKTPPLVLKYLHYSTHSAVHVLLMHSQQSASMYVRDREAQFTRCKTRWKMDNVARAARRICTAWKSLRPTTAGHWCVLVGARWVHAVLQLIFQTRPRENICAFRTRQ